MRYIFITAITAITALVILGLFALAAISDQAWRDYRGIEVKVVQKCYPIDHIMIDGKPFEGTWSVVYDPGYHVAYIKMSLEMR